MSTNIVVDSKTEDIPKFEKIKIHSERLYKEVMLGFTVWVTVFEGKDQRHDEVFF